MNQKQQRLLATSHAAAKAAQAAPRVAPAAAPLRPTPQAAPRPAPNGAPPRRPFTPPHLETREFRFPDGRPVTIAKFAVTFCCPCRDDPERTVVGIKGAINATPLAIPYDEFKAWWQQK